MSTISNLATFFLDGGMWMWAILAAQIVSIAIIIERVYVLFVLRKPNARKMIQIFEEDIRKGQIDRVIAKAQTMGDANPIAMVTQAGAQAAIDMGGREEIQASMEEVIVEENTRLDRRTAFLAMLGNVGTLLGLLGTVVGMIDAFGSVSAASPAEKGIILARGISTAMNTTAYGLVMAIPALVMYAILQNRANLLNEDLSKAAMRIFVLLGFKYESIPSQKNN